MNLTNRTPNGDPNEAENHFKDILSKQEITNQELVLVGDLILMSLTLMKVKRFTFCECNVSIWPDSHRT